jgi:hypothetical protein
MPSARDHRPISARSNIVCASNERCLLQTLKILPVVIGGEAVLDTIGGRQDPQYAGREFNLVDVSNGLFTDRERTAGKLDEVVRIGMSEVTVLPDEPDAGHRIANLSDTGKACLDEIEILRHVFPVAVDAHAGTPGKDHVDAVSMEMRADVRRQLSDGHLRDGFQSGFPRRRGRRRLIVSALRTSSG